MSALGLIFDSVSRFRPSAHFRWARKPDMDSAA